jgi:hypothetical protein
MAYVILSYLQERWRERGASPFRKGSKGAKVPFFILGKYLRCFKKALKNPYIHAA